MPKRGWNEPVGRGPAVGERVARMVLATRGTLLVLDLHAPPLSRPSVDARISLLSADVEEEGGRAGRSAFPWRRVWRRMTGR